MAETKKINELGVGALALNNLFINGGETNGISYKNTLQELINFINVTSGLAFRGSLAIADTPALDGWYFPSETGPYTNAGGVVVTLANNFNIIIASSTQTVFQLLVNPINITTNGVVIGGNVDAVNGNSALLGDSPFINEATLGGQFLNAVKEVRLFGVSDKTKEYSLAIIKKNEAVTTNWQLTIYETTGTGFVSNVCFFLSAGYVPSDGVDKVILNDSGASGIDAYVYIDWSEITDGTVTSAMNYPTAGLKNITYESNPIISSTSKDVVLADDLQASNDLIDVNSALVVNNAENINIVNKAGQTSGIETTVLGTSENTNWAVDNSFDERYHAIRLIMVNDFITNKIQLPFRKNFDGVDIVGDMVVKIGINGSWFFEKTITNAELVSWGLNAQTTSTPAADSLYGIDLPIHNFKTGDDVYIGWGFVNAADKLTFQYDNNDPAGTQYANRYIVDDATDITAITSVPTITSTGGWTFVHYFVLVDYIAKKIQDGGVVKPTISNVFPSKIYTVCDDIDQTDSGFNTRNYASMLYADHLLKLTNLTDVYWDKTKDDKLPIFSPISEDNATYNGGVNVLTTPISEILTGSVQDITVAFDHISTKSTVGAASFPKVLFIGDSVTGSFLANRPTSVTDTNPTAFWSYITKLFYLDKLSNGSTGHDFISLGVDDSRPFNVDATALRSFAEGRGGWTTRDFLYSKDFLIDNNRFYDVAKVGTVKFSLTKYLERYKTLADDGVTRLLVGSTAGTEVTNATDYDVCTPTHVVIQLGFNDSEANWSGDIDLMIAEIKAEYPNMIILLSTIDASGTYFPDKYPMFDKTSVNMVGSALHNKMYNLVAAAKAKEDVPDKILYCPSYFVQPTAWGVPYREVNPPEYIANEDFIFKTRFGAGGDYHPNTYAHSAWAYQMYSLLKYSLTL